MQEILCTASSSSDTVEVDPGFSWEVAATWFRIRLWDELLQVGSEWIPLVWPAFAIQDPNWSTHNQYLYFLNRLTYLHVYNNNKKNKKKNPFYESLIYKL